MYGAHFLSPSLKYLAFNIFPSTLLLPPLRINEKRYLLCYTISKSFVLNFVLIVMLLALDFWTVKNVTGRFLVGGWSFFFSLDFEYLRGIYFAHQARRYSYIYIFILFYFIKKKRTRPSFCYAPASLSHPSTAILLPSFQKSIPFFFSFFFSFSHFSLNPCPHRSPVVEQGGR